MLGLSASQVWFMILVLAVGCERLAELRVARRNRRWSLDRCGVEYGRGHYPAIVGIQLGLLIGCVVETWWRSPEFQAVLGIPMLALVIMAQGLRWWCIRTLGPRWNTRVIIVPGLALVRRGPYRIIPHPNYVAVVVEGAALPLVHTAWITALAFTLANAAVLRVRIGVENRALRRANEANVRPES